MQITLSILIRNDGLAHCLHKIAFPPLTAEMACQNRSRVEESEGAWFTRDWFSGYFLNAYRFQIGRENKSLFVEDFSHFLNRNCLSIYPQPLENIGRRTEVEAFCVINEAKLLNLLKYYIRCKSIKMLIHISGSYSYMYSYLQSYRILKLAWINSFHQFLNVFDGNIQ